jgi:hypothetical protein
MTSWLDQLSRNGPNGPNPWERRRRRTPLAKIGSRCWYLLFRRNILYLVYSSHLTNWYSIFVKTVMNQTHYWVGFEVLTAVSMKMAVFGVVAPCSLVELYHRFRGPCCLHHQGNSTRLHCATTQKTAIFRLIIILQFLFLLKLVQNLLHTRSSRRVTKIHKKWMKWNEH